MILQLQGGAVVHGGCLFCVFLVSDTGVGGVGLGSFSELPFPGSSDSSVLVAIQQTFKGV